MNARGCIGFLLIVIVGLLLFFVMASGQMGRSGSPASRANVSPRSSSLTCAYEENMVSGYEGVGIYYSSNVRASLSGASGVINPSTTETQVDDDGETFLANIYSEERLTTGAYTVRVVDRVSGDTLLTHIMNVRSGESPVLTVICR